MTIALYATIWLSLIGLLVSELGRARERTTLVPLPWALASSAAGVVLGIVHAFIALGAVHDWNHSEAVAMTAQRAADLYGVRWAGSLYMNYVFLAWWAIDTGWWWFSPTTFIRRSAAIEWLWRLLTFTMVINGAVIFASPAGRIAGVPLTAGLLWIWFGLRKPRP